VNTRRVITGAGIVIALWLALAFATYHGWIRGTDHRDFYPRWAGARLALFEGRDLYSDDTTRAMQILLYDAERPLGVDPQAFAYPAIIVPMLLPFWFIEDVEIATAAWEATSVLILAGTLLLVRQTYGHAPRWVVALLLLWYYPILMIFQAQITAIPLASIAISYWAYVNRRDVLAGALLPLGFIKPEQVLIPVVLLLIAALYHRRWRVLVGFAGSGVLLLAASMLVTGGWWVDDWLAAVQRYAGYAPTFWSIGTLWTIQPLLITVFFGFVVWMISRMQADIHSITAASVPLGLLLLPQTLIWGQTLLLLPLMLSWRGAGRWWVLTVWLVGWLLILGTGIEGWWQFQSLLLPALTLLTIAVASRAPALHPAPVV
jgi:hypothetical protein